MKNSKGLELDLAGYNRLRDDDPAKSVQLLTNAMDLILADRIRDKSLDQRLYLSVGPAAPAPGRSTKKEKKATAKAKAVAAAKAQAKAEGQQQQQQPQTTSRSSAAPGTQVDQLVCVT